MLTLLIDADVLRYQHAFANTARVDWDGDGKAVEVVNEKKARKDTAEYIAELVDKFGADDYVLALSCKRHNFRKDVYPTYKSGRHAKAKPSLWYAIDEFIYADYADKIVERPTLEGDDILGLLATHPSPKAAPGDRIVVSIDKDLQTIPCSLFNPSKPDIGVREISENAANLFWMKQVLTGDSTDEYPGCPGIGPVKADAVLVPVSTANRKSAPYAHLAGLWDAVVDTYESKDLTADDALIQARCARILRHGDYNFAAKRVHLWIPTT